MAAAAGLTQALRSRGFTVQEQPHSLNAQLPGSRLRLQVTVNARYAAFPGRAVPGKVLRFDLPVACLEDLLRGKLWAATDPARRPSKRQKDRLDVTRLCEAHPRLLPLVPPGLIPEVDELKSVETEKLKH